MMEAIPSCFNNFGMQRGGWDESCIGGKRIAIPCNHVGLVVWSGMYVWEHLLQPEVGLSSEIKSA